MFTKDGIHTLAHIAIVDSMCANLLPQSYTIQRFVAFNVTHAKERTYCDQHPTNRFFSLATEIFGCLHKQADVFLYKCANAI